MGLKKVKNVNGTSKSLYKVDNLSTKFNKITGATCSKCQVKNCRCASVMGFTRGGKYPQKKGVPFWGGGGRSIPTPFVKTKT